MKFLLYKLKYKKKNQENYLLQELVHHNKMN